MKLILSRKGFDSANGGCPSPILPDGTMLSLPIPDARESASDKLCTPQLGFADLLNETLNLSYDEIWSSIGKKTYQGNQPCHLDPDIRKIRRVCEVDGWEPAFGQCGAAQTHLENQGVGIGDLFLFFGWFRPVEKGTKTPVRYIRNARDIHALYGYLQVGEVLKGECIAHRFPWHPHASPLRQQLKGNTLYVPANGLSCPGVPNGLPGYGVFHYADDLVLTAPGMSRSRWTVLDWMHVTTISHHSSKSLHQNYFQSVPIGQEFVVGECPESIAWIGDIFSNHAEELLQSE